MRPDTPSDRALACTASFIQGNSATQHEDQYIPGCCGRAVVGRARPQVLFRHSSPDLTDQVPQVRSPQVEYHGWRRQAAVAAGGRAGGCGCRRRLRVQTVDGLPAGARGRAGRHAQHEALGTDSCRPWRGMHMSHVRALTFAGAGGHGLLCQQFKCTATA